MKLAQLESELTVVLTGRVKKQPLLRDQIEIFVHNYLFAHWKEVEHVPTGSVLSVMKSMFDHFDLRRAQGATRNSYGHIAREMVLMMLSALSPTQEDKPSDAYPITELSAGDLQDAEFTKEEAEVLQEYLPEMALKMRDAYLETRFWGDLRIFGRLILDRLAEEKDHLPR
jgi:hypothetical protein